MRKYAWWSVNLLILLVIAGITYGLLFQRQALIDWWRIHNFTPSPAVAAIAANTSLTPFGHDLFYASEPEVDEAAVFSQNCKNENEQSVVLGCYTHQRIYVFDVSDPKLSGVKEVTAAHEMLHAAYHRLSPADKARIDALVGEQLGKITDPRIQSLVTLYNKQEPGELLNEMHSIIGTEYRAISPELETYYQKYFSDRGKVVGYAEQYVAVFKESQERLAAFDNQLASLKKTIESHTAELERRKQQLDNSTAELNTLRGTDPTAYNQKAAVYNAAVREFNALVGTTRAEISQYNQLVVQRNAEAAAQNNLYHSLDSRYQAVTTQ